VCNIKSNGSCQDAMFASMPQGFASMHLLNVVISWDIAPCSLYVNHHFEGTYHLCFQGKKSSCLAGFLIGWFFILKMEVILFSKMLVHIQTTRRYNPEDGNIHNYCCENLISHMYWSFVSMYDLSACVNCLLAHSMLANKRPV
jgi:hypothetical protein